MTGTTLEERMEQLRRRISGCGQLLVSFSGGVDSGLLAALGKEILGDNVQAVFIDSPLVPSSAVLEAREMAGLLGISLGIITAPFPRSEEHTSELQSREKLVCRLLLEKKKNRTAGR